MTDTPYSLNKYSQGSTMGKKGKKVMSQNDLARMVELDALESRLQEPLPPLPPRFTSRSSPVSAPFSSEHAASTSHTKSRLFSDFTPYSQDDHSSRLSHRSNSSDITRLDERIACLDEDISVLVAISATGSLLFAQDPRNQESYHRRQADTMGEPNIGRHALLPSSSVNQHFLHIEYKLCSILRELETLLSKRLVLDRQRTDCERLATQVESALVTLDTQKEVEWHRQRPVSSNTNQRVINAGQYSHLSKLFRPSDAHIPQDSILRPLDPRTQR